MEQLVEEIMEDIDNEEFDEAYIKCESIRYTADWSEEIKEKWEGIRKEVINQIIEEEIRATGDSSHASKKDKWWDKLFN